MQRDYPPIPDRYDVIRPVVGEPAQVPAEPWRSHHQDHLVPGGDDLFKLGSQASLGLLVYDENLCSWLPLTRRLTALGDRVVLWDYGGSGPVPRGPAAGPGPPGALTRECPARRVESFGCG
jgi:hypothetical protein